MDKIDPLMETLKKGYKAKVTAKINKEIREEESLEISKKSLRTSTKCMHVSIVSALIALISLGILLIKIK